MSSVTDIVVLGTLDDEGDEFITLQIGPAVCLVKVPDQMYLQGKSHQWDVWVGTGNYLDSGELLDSLRRWPWLDPIDVTVMTRHEENDYGWTIHRLSDNEPSTGGK